MDAAAEQDLPDAGRRLAHAPERRDPHGERCGYPEARQQGDEVRRDAGVQESGQGRDQGVEAARDGTLAPGPREWRVAQATRAPRDLAVARGRDGEVEGHGQERERRVGNQRAAPAEPLAKRVADRPEHRRREAAEEGDLRHRPPRLGPADSRERREGRLVQREPHPEAEAEPRGVVERELTGRRDPDAA
jgi:hypothetical protein